jgi:hypothetical protein
MNAVSRQRRTNARRIAHAAVLHAAEPHLPALPPSSLRSGTVSCLPVAARDRADAVSGEPATLDLLGGELLCGRALVAVTSAPAHGRVVLHDDATATYTSAPGFVGADSFGYRFTDERGRTSRVVVMVTVSPAGEPLGGRAALACAA